MEPMDAYSAMYTETVTAEVEDFNVLLDLFVRFDAKQILFRLC